MSLPTSLILEPTKYLRNTPDIIFGVTKPIINKKGLREYPKNYNPILEYWDQIQTKKTLVPKKVYQQYEEIVRWIKNGGYGEWFYSVERANHIIEFAENFCHHSKGKLAGKKVILELWEKAYLASIYGFIDIEGYRKHQKVVLIVGKKNGKSLLDSIQGLYGLVGDGEGGPECYAVATKKDQAKIVWLEAKRMVAKSPELKKRVRALVGEINSDFNDGIFKALASDSDSMDGLNIHVVIMDEWHQWKNGRALYDIMADGITAREQPLIIMTSTAGTIREDIFDEIYEEAEIQFNNMKLENEVDDRTLFFIYELDNKQEWWDANNWIKANPGINTIKKLRALQDKAKRVAANLRLEKNFVCKEFNIRETSVEAWLSFEELNNTDTYDLAKLKPRYGIGGSDLSSTTDLTCATVIFKVRENESVFVKQMYFLPEDLLEQRTREDKIPYDIWEREGLLRTTPGNKIHYKYVTEWFLEVQNNEKIDIYIPWHGYDGWSAEYYVEEMRGYFGMEGMEPVIQGKKTLSGPMKSLGADLADKKINYNNNPILKWCLSNTMADRDKNDNIQPIKTSKSRRRIDGMASLLNAYVVLERHYEEYINMI